MDIFGLNNKRKNNAGLTIIELLAALFIISAGIVTSAGLITRTFSQTMELSPRLTAVHLAQEGIEIVESIRTTNWLRQRRGEDGVSWTDGILPDGQNTVIGRVDIDEYFEELYETNNPDNFLLYQNNNGFFIHDSNMAETPLRRSLEINKVDDPEHLLVRVIVEWRERGEWRDWNRVEAYTKLYNWL